MGSGAGSACEQKRGLIGFGVGWLMGFGMGVGDELGIGNAVKTGRVVQTRGVLITTTERGTKPGKNNVLKSRIARPLRLVQKNVRILWEIEINRPLARIRRREKSQS